jgi:hypothetical protein
MPDREIAFLLDAPKSAVSKVQVAMLGDDFKDPRYGDFAITAADVADWKRNLAALPGGKALIDADHLADAPKPFRNTEAYGWITDVNLVDDVPTADVEWTPKGVKALEDKTYAFLSPVYGPHKDHTGKTIPNVFAGASLTNKPFLPMPQVLLASADAVCEAMLDEDPAQVVHRLLLEGFTDSDTLKQLADVSAATRREYAEKGWALKDGSYPIGNTSQLRAAAVLAASKHGDYKAAEVLIRRRAKDLGVDVTTLPGFGSGSSSDTRPQMKLDADILKALGITDEADQKTILDLYADEKTEPVKLFDAIDTAKAKAAKAKEDGDADDPAKKTPATPARKALEQQAADAGLVLLDAEQTQKLLSDAAAGRQAADTLTATLFDNAWTKALENPAGPSVAPADEELYRALYTAKPDETLKLLDSMKPILGAKPKGSVQTTTDGLEVPDGMDPDSFRLDQEVRKYAAEHKLDPSSDYLKCLEAVTRTPLMGASA